MPGGEPAFQLRTRPFGHLNCVDLHDGHGSSLGPRHVMETYRAVGPSPKNTEASPQRQSRGDDSGRFAG